MTAGRPKNPVREAARIAGSKRYVDSKACEICDSHEKYTRNGGCVPCSIARAKLRYGALDQGIKDALNKATYMKRLTSDSESGKTEPSPRD